MKRNFTKASSRAPQVKDILYQPDREAWGGAPSAATDHSLSPNLDEAAKFRDMNTHFRILVMGRANAGKTTLLKRVCNTTEDPVYVKVGYQHHFN